MELRLRKIFRPAGYLIAIILKRASIPPGRLIALSYLTAITTLLGFYLLSNLPYSTILTIIIVLLIFLSGLLDEIVMEFKKLRSGIGELERMNLMIDRYSDVLIIVGTSYYLDDQIYRIVLKGTQFQLSVSSDLHLILGGLIVAGILLLNFMSRKTTTGEHGLETRGERMFLLSIFAFIGLYYDFEGSLFIGLFILGTSIYTAIIHLSLAQRRSHHISYSRHHPFYKAVRYLAGTIVKITGRALVIGSNVVKVSTAEAARLVKIKLAFIKNEAKRRDITLPILHPVFRRAEKKVKTNPSKSQDEPDRSELSPFSPGSAESQDGSNRSNRSESPPFSLKKESEVRVEKFDAAQLDYAGVPGHNFTVVVTDKMTKFPIPNVEVVLKNREINKKGVSHTDESGRCDFKDVVEGQYNIKITLDGFKEEECERYISMDSGEVFALEERPVDLSVVVSDSEWATPISNAEVSLVSNTGTKDSKRTDNLGVAYFEGLSRRGYEIAVEMKGYEPEKTKVDIQKENIASVNLKKKPVQGEAEAPESYSKLLGESALIAFTSTGEVEDVLMKIIEDYLDKKREVVLVSAPPRTALYKTNLKNEISEGKVSVINLVTSGRVSGDYGELTEIPMTNLEYFKTVFERMPAGSTMIFEPLSNLILNTSADLAYKFISKMVDHLSNEGLCFVCLLNVDGHDEKEIGSFGNLFMNILQIDTDRLVRK